MELQYKTLLLIHCTTSKQNFTGRKVAMEKIYKNGFEQN